MEGTMQTMADLFGERGLGTPVYCALYSNRNCKIPCGVRLPLQAGGTTAMQPHQRQRRVNEARCRRKKNKKKKL